MKNENSLGKHIAHAGFCSRRKAALLVKSGSVKVNEVIITEPGYKVSLSDEVRVEGTMLRGQQEKIYVLLNKPRDYITTLSDQGGRRTVIDLVRPTIKQRIYPVGRLDRNTTGLLLLTNDGTLTNRLAHPRYRMKKIYTVTLDKVLQYSVLQKIEEGIFLEDGRVPVDAVSFVLDKSYNQIRLVLHSGKYRVIRRMFKKLGYNVVKLDRVGYAGLTKKGLPIGTWRYLTQKEVSLLTLYTH